MRLEGKDKNTWVDFDKKEGKLSKYEHLKEWIDLKKAHSELKKAK